MALEPGPKPNGAAEGDANYSIPLKLAAVPVGTHYIEQHYLYAFAPQAEILHYVRTQAIDTERERLPIIVAGWTKVQPRVSALQQTEASTADSIGTEAIPSQHLGRIAEIRSDPLFQKTFANHPITFGMVEIDKVVAAQRSVNLAYVRKLRAQLSSDRSMDALIDFFLSPGKTTEPIQHLEVAQNVHVFSSPNSDLRFLGAFRKEIGADDLSYAAGGGLPATAVIGFIGYGASSVNAFTVGGRIFLNNGFHRVYAARQAGIKHVPVVLKRVGNIQLEFPPAIAGIPREYLLGVSRPVLMKDFFETDFTINLKTRDRIRAVIVQVVANQHDVPA